MRERLSKVLMFLGAVCTLFGWVAAFGWMMFVRPESQWFLLLIPIGLFCVLLVWITEKTAPYGHPMRGWGDTEDWLLKKLPRERLKEELLLLIRRCLERGDLYSAIHFFTFCHKEVGVEQHCLEIVQYLLQHKEKKLVRKFHRLPPILGRLTAAEIGIDLVRDFLADAKQDPERPEDVILANIWLGQDADLVVLNDALFRVQIGLCAVHWWLFLQEAVGDRCARKQ